jgi:hypothetical protein
MNLEAIVTEQTTEPIELPRLTVQATFLTYGRIGTQLDIAGRAYKDLPDASTVQSAAESLKEIIKACEHVIKSANRLMEGNR